MVVVVVVVVVLLLLVVVVVVGFVVAAAAVPAAVQPPAVARRVLALVAVQERQDVRLLALGNEVAHHEEARQAWVGRFRFDERRRRPRR